MEYPNLIDGVKMHRANPDTFSIPTNSEKLAVVAGDSVKIGILLPERARASAERFWVTVVSNDTTAKHIVGKVDNDLLFTHIHGFKYRDEIEFGYDQILTIYG